MGRADQDGNAHSSTGQSIAMSDDAVDWFVRLRDPALSDQDRRNFATWLRQSPAHAAAMQDVSEIWEGLGALPNLQRVGAGIYQPRLARHGHLTRRHLMTGLGLTATALAVGWGIARHGGIAAARGEHRRASLGQHAALELDSLSTLDLNAGDPHPAATLRRGQVFVVTDRPPTEPVTLQLPFGRVSAAAAQFNVKLERHRAVVSVQSGSVRIDRPRGGSQELGSLTELAFGDDVVEPVRALPAYRVAPWRRGRLIFDRTRLVDVIDDINRYRAGQVMIGDPRLDDLLVTGDFDCHRTDDALTAVAHAFSLESLHFGDALTVLFSA